MRKQKNDEMAIIFRAKNYQNGKLEYIPVDVKKGNYDEENDMFIDNKGTGYYHIILEPASYGYFSCTDIQNYQKEHPKVPLSLLKKVVLHEYQKNTYEYIIEDETEAPVILIKPKKEEKSIKPLIDSYMIMYYTKYYERFMSDVLKLTISIIESENNKNEIEFTTEDQVSQREKNLLEEKGNAEENSCNTLIENKIDAELLYNAVTSRVVGQDDQIKKIITAIWKHYNNFSDDKSRNILINGQTAVGKTEIFRAISKLIDVPCVLVDATRYSATGYIGQNIEDMLEKLLLRADGDLKRAENGILIIDEVDKLSDKGASSSVNQKDVQEGLLKLIEDGTFTVTYKGKNVEFNTGKLLVIAGGSWSNIDLEKKNIIGFNSSKEEKKKYHELTKEDFVNNGMLPEFLGRFPITVQMNSLSVTEFIQILKNPHGILRTNIEFFKNQQVELEVTDEAIEAIARLAIKEKFGARSLDEIIEKTLSGATFQIATNPSVYQKLIITDKTVQDSNNYTLIKRENNIPKKKIRSVEEGK